MNRVAFRNAFAQIRQHIGDGDTYQVNLTFAIGGAFEGDPAGVVRESGAGRNAAATRASYRPREWAICSASPELFFAFDGPEIRSSADEGHRAAWSDNRRRRGPA